jgi:hypothetical protein
MKMLRIPHFEYLLVLLSFVLAASSLPSAEHIRKQPVYLQLISKK